MQSLVSWVFLMKFLFHDKSIFSFSIKTEESVCRLCLTNAEQDDRMDKKQNLINSVKSLFELIVPSRYVSYLVGFSNYYH